MNKYQEALDELSFPLDDSSCGGCKCGTSDCIDCKKAQAVLTLEELVERAEQKKVINKQQFNVGFSDDLNLTIDVCCCPACKKGLYKFGAYCYHCGQALDWSDEE